MTFKNVESAVEADAEHKRLVEQLATVNHRISTHTIPLRRKDFAAWEKACDKEQELLAAREELTRAISLRRNEVVREWSAKNYTVRSLKFS